MNDTYSKNLLINVLRLLPTYRPYRTSREHHCFATDTASLQDAFGRLILLSINHMKLAAIWANAIFQLNLQIQVEAPALQIQEYGHGSLFLYNADGYRILKCLYLYLQ